MKKLPIFTLFIIIIYSCSQEKENELYLPQSDCYDWCGNGVAIPIETDEPQFCPCICDEGYHGDFCNEKE